VADQQGLIAFLHPTTGRELSRIFSEDSEARTLCFSPDGRNLVEAGMDKMIRIWDVLTGQELLTLEGHAAQINALAFSPDGSTLASADHGGAVRLWHAREERDSGPVPVVHHDGPDPTRWARLPARRACSGCEERDPKPD
jgi:WD40 repeat protein